MQRLQALFARTARGPPAAREVRGVGRNVLCVAGRHGAREKGARLCFQHPRHHSPAGCSLCLPGVTQRGAHAPEPEARGPLAAQGGKRRRRRFGSRLGPRGRDAPLTLRPGAAQGIAPLAALRPQAPPGREVGKPPPPRSLSRNRRGTRSFPPSSLRTRKREAGGWRDGERVALGTLFRSRLCGVTRVRHAGPPVLSGGGSSGPRAARGWGMRKAVPSLARAPPPAPAPPGCRQREPVPAGPSRGPRPRLPVSPGRPSPARAGSSPGRKGTSP